MDFSEVKQHGSVFGFLDGLVKAGNVKGLEPILTRKMMSTVAKHLGNISPRFPMSQDSILNEVMARLNEFSYSYSDDPLFKLNDQYMERLCPNKETGW